jgi:hypothetical protein
MLLEHLEQPTYFSSPNRALPSPHPKIERDNPLSGAFVLVYFNFDSRVGWTA